MEDLHVYCDEMEARLREWRAELDRLDVQARMAKGDREMEIKDEIYFLKTKMRGVGDKLRDLRGMTGESCVLLRKDTEEAMKDLERSFESATSKFK